MPLTSLFDIFGDSDDPAAKTAKSKSKKAAAKKPAVANTPTPSEPVANASTEPPAKKAAAE